MLDWAKSSSESAGALRGGDHGLKALPIVASGSPKVTRGWLLFAIDLAAMMGEQKLVVRGFFQRMRTGFLAAFVVLLM